MSPSVNHSYVQVALSAALFKMQEYSVYSELSIEIQGKEYVPDICIYAKRNFTPLQDMMRMKEVPLLAIEILSPSQIIQELMDKIEIYLNAGVQSCWLVIPTTCTVAIFHDLERPANLYNQDKIVDDKLNISLPLNEIFPF